MITFTAGPVTAHDERLMTQLERERVTEFGAIGNQNIFLIQKKLFLSVYKDVRILSS